MKKTIRANILTAFFTAIVLLLVASHALAGQVELTRTLKKGMRGEDVAAVQQFLKDQGFYNYYKITGYFGSITEEAVKAFQRYNGLVADGIIGPVTRSAINEILSGAGSDSHCGDCRVHIVKAGDTMWKISQIYGVQLEKLLDVNNMTAHSVIYVGQKIVIPGDEKSSQGQVIHVVKAGDTMWKISQQYHVPLERLLVDNGMTKDSVLYVGQKIVIPRDNPSDRGSGTTTDKPNIKYVTHTVMKGDNLWTLSYRYGVPVKEIADANGITTSTTLYVGQTLKIPQHIIPIKPTPGPQYGELLDWWTEAQYVFPLNSIATVTDFKTGVSYRVKRTYGYGHADVEPLTAEDTRIMKGIWEKHEVLWNGTVNYWARRPVIIHIDGRKLAASASAMLHAGVDSAPDGSYVDWRSGGFGPGTNYDRIKGNNADGHADVHFLNSTRHKDGEIDEKHQAMIRIAAGE